jgi:hypothetical protein
MRRAAGMVELSGGVGVEQRRRTIYPDVNI